MSKNTFRSQLLKFAPVFAFLGYGSWVFSVNYVAESENFIQSGLIQGAYAFISTLFVRMFTLKLHHNFIDYKHTKLMTFMTMFVLMVIIPVFLHLLSSTGKILYSVLPGIIIGGAYLIVILKLEITDN